MRAAPRTDPYVQHYRIRLLLRVFGAEARVRMRMQDPGLRNPEIGELPKAYPWQARPLATLMAGQGNTHARSPSACRSGRSNAHRGLGPRIPGRRGSRSAEPIAPGSAGRPSRSCALSSKLYPSARGGRRASVLPLPPGVLGPVKALRTVACKGDRGGNRYEIAGLSREPTTSEL